MCNSVEGFVRFCCPESSMFPGTIIRSSHPPVVGPRYCPALLTADGRPVLYRPGLCPLSSPCSRCLNSIDGGKPIESIPTGGYRSMRHLAPPTLGSASPLASLVACVHGCKARLLSASRHDDKNQRWLMNRPVRRVGQTEKGLRMRSPWRFIGVSWRDRSVESRRAGSVSLGP